MNNTLPAKSRYACRQRGAALIEFALVLPLLLAFTIGIIYYGYVFMLDAAVTHAAKQGAQVAVNLDPLDFASPADYQDAVVLRVSNSVSNSLDWLPPSVHDGLILPPSVSFIAAPAGQAGMLLNVTVVLSVAGGSSPLLPQITLPVIGSVPPLPLTLNGVAQVVL